MKLDTPRDIESFPFRFNLAAIILHRDYIAKLLPQPQVF